MQSLPRRIAGAVLVLFLAAGCESSRGLRITPDKTWSGADWTEEEKAREIAVRNLWQTSEASAHRIRLAKAEKPHVHEHHDLTVFVLKGSARVFLDGRFVIACAGDVVEIPRGTLHWAQNLEKWPSEVYAVFTPSYDGRDMRIVLDKIPEEVHPRAAAEKQS